jgi:hypothetical protein
LHRGWRGAFGWRAPDRVKGFGGVNGVMLDGVKGFGAINGVNGVSGFSGPRAPKPAPRPRA